MTTKLFLSLFFYTLLLLTSITAWSKDLTTDKYQQVVVEADKAKINPSTGIVNYQGNVIVTHELLTINCETLDLIDTDTRRSFTAFGNSTSPATITWKHENGQSYGSADSIVYLESPTSQNIVLKGQVKIEHLGNTIKGRYVYYDFLTKQLDINTVDTPKSSTGKKGRMQIILKQK